MTHSVSSTPRTGENLLSAVFYVGVEHPFPSSRAESFYFYLLLLIIWCCWFLPARESTPAVAAVFPTSCRSIAGLCGQRRPPRGHLDGPALVYTDTTTGHRSRNNQEWAEGCCPRARAEDSTQESSQKHLKLKNQRQQQYLERLILSWALFCCYHYAAAS